MVNALSKSFRYIALYKPGDYVVRLTYNGGMTSVAHWNVKPLAESRKAKNVVLFIGDGMTSSMITAARLLGHKSINVCCQGVPLLEVHSSDVLLACAGQVPESASAR